MTGDGSDDEDFTSATKKQKAPPAPAASSTSALATPATTAPLKKAAAAAAPARQGASLTGEDAVLEMIQRLNAPVNAQMISDRFRGSLSKPCAEKHLLALHEAGLIKYKENGKAKIFWANQEHMDVPTEAELQQLDREIEDARAKRQELDAKLKELQQAARAQKAKRTLGDVQREIVMAKAELEDAVELLEKDRAALGKQGTIAPLSQKEGEAVASEYSRLLREYKKRRRLCLELLANVGEGCGQTAKQLMAKWSLETDEEYGITMTQFPTLDPKMTQTPGKTPGKALGGKTHGKEDTARPPMASVNNKTSTSMRLK